MTAEAHLREHGGAHGAAHSPGRPRIHYDGRRFSPVAAPGDPVPVAHYHQNDDLLWGEFAGGGVRHGSIVGTARADGELTFAYCMLLDSGETVTGHCHSIPEVLADGRIRLAETWERQGPPPSRGVSVLEELEPPAGG